MFLLLVGHVTKCIDSYLRSNFGINSPGTGIYVKTSQQPQPPQYCLLNQNQRLGEIKEYIRNTEVSKSNQCD